mmetsp:Transcript_34711/g.82226  ORF Transcript_34711/g.82226 Transcript_34711/m.82226 type:complete len:449 (-) Transcript_34711:87-1433(-)
MSNALSRMNVSIFVEGTTLCWAKMTLALPPAAPSTSIGSTTPSLDQERAMGYGHESATANSRTRKLGEIIAAHSAHPLETASSELRVRFGSLPRNSRRAASTRGERVAEPTTSISSSWSNETLESLITRLTGSRARSMRGWVIFAHVSVSIELEKSRSSWRHSTLMGSLVSVVYPESCCFSLSIAVSSRSTALGLSLMLSLFLACHSAAKCSSIALSNSRPPRLRSKPEARTVILLFVNATMHTWVVEWPMSKKRQCLGGAVSSGNSIDLGRPQHSAVAAVSESSRSTLMPAMLAASRVARRWASVNQQGTETTQSGDGDLLWLSAVALRLTKSMASSCSGVNPCTSTACPSFSYGRLIRMPPSGASVMRYGAFFMSSCTSVSAHLRPIKRLRSVAVFLTLELILAAPATPTARSLEPRPTMQGVLRDDASLSITSMPPLRAMATTQF